MILKKSPFYIQDKNSRDLDNVDNVDNFPSVDELTRDQNLSNGKANTVHRRSDLDSLG